MAQQRLLLVDSNNVGWRAFHAGGGLSLSSRGIPTAMSALFLNQLHAALVFARPSSVMLAWDGGSPKFRLQLLPTYKQRGPMDAKTLEAREQFHQQRNWLLELLPKLGCHWALRRDWEADDLIALAAQLRQESMLVTIFSGDRDLWQLVNERVAILLPGRKLTDTYDTLTHENFTAKTGVRSPAQWLMLRALTGDSSDRIPGICRVGEKTAAKMLAQELPLGTLTNEKMDIYDRNLQLMNLRHSAALLQRELQERPQDGQYGVASARDLPGAREYLNQYEFHRMTAGWARWSAPFAELD